MLTHHATKLIAGAFALLLAGHTLAAESDELQEVEAALENARARAAALAEQADSVAAEIAALQARMVESALAAQQSEATLLQLEGELAGLEKSEAATNASLMAERERLVDTLAALERLSMQPREAMILRPGAPVDTVRSAMLLKVAVPTLQDRAAVLREQLQRLGDLRIEIARRRAQQEESLAALQDENARLDGLMGEMRALKQQTDTERSQTEREMAALAGKAKDMEELIAELARTREEARLRQEQEEAARAEREREEEERRQQEALLQPPPEPPAATPPPQTDASLPAPEPDHPLRPFPKDGVGIVVPAAGVLVLHYNEPNDAGIKSRGITLRTRPGARVVAPFDGQVVFRGPFRGYGEILLIEHAGEYHTLLAGLGRTDAVANQWLEAGEPVGIMGPADDGNPKLYVELRRRGIPIDPARWLGFRDN